MDVVLTEARQGTERVQDAAGVQCTGRMRGIERAREIAGGGGVGGAGRIARKLGRAGRARLALGAALCCAGTLLATDYVWTGGGNDEYYHTAANWSPNTGWPSCCDDAAVVTDVDSGSGWTYVWLSASGLTGAAVEQVTVKEEENGGHDGQTVEFHHQSGSDPVLRCEVYVVDAVDASYPVTAQVSGAAMVQTVPTCICSIGG